MSLWIFVAKVVDNGARAWPVWCWGDSGLAACCPESNEPTLMFLWHFYPEISLWSLSMEVYGTLLLRCSKWLLGAWLDSFTMILRCWLVVWVKWARPLVSMTLWSRVMFNWKAVQLKGRPISWAVLHPLKVNGANFSTLLPPRGATFTPFWGMVLQSLPALFNVANFTFLWNPLSELRGRQIFFAMLSQWGKFMGTLLPPRGATLPHFEVWSYRACQPLQMWQISHFCEIHFLSYEASKFFAMLSQCVWFCPYFAPGQTSYPRSLIKS